MPQLPLSPMYKLHPFFRFGTNPFQNDLHIRCTPNFCSCFQELKGASLAWVVTVLVPAHGSCGCRWHTGNRFLKHILSVELLGRGDKAQSTLDVKGHHRMLKHKETCKWECVHTGYTQHQRNCLQICMVASSVDWALAHTIDISDTD